jgi:hypothetical protein
MYLQYCSYVISPVNISCRPCVRLLLLALNFPPSQHNHQNRALNTITYFKNPVANKFENLKSQFLLSCRFAWAQTIEQVSLSLQYQR